MSRELQHALLLHAGTTPPPVEHACLQACLDVCVASGDRHLHKAGCTDCQRHAAKVLPAPHGAGQLLPAGAKDGVAAGIRLQIEMHRVQQRRLLL